MATSIAIQSLLGSPFSSRKGLNRQFIPVNQTSRLLIKRTDIRVRAMAEDSDKKISPNNPAQPPSTPPLTPPPPAPKAPKVSTKFEDVMAFSGPGPERINGRLAMIGFVAAIGVELARGQGLFSQICEGGVPWFLGTSVLFTLASLVPLFKGVRAEAKSDGVMTSDAELWNGRFAMLGLVALAFTEYVKGGALV